MSKNIASIICVFNDEEILDKYLRSSINDITEDLYELILIDNSNDSYESAAAALNAGAEKAKGEVLIFPHQDVKFLEDSWLSSIIRWVSNIEDLGVAGITGLSEEGSLPSKKARNTLFHGPEKQEWKLGTKIKSPCPVQTVDELCIIIPSAVFSDYQFNENICSGWHLYAVEYCLRIRYRTELTPYVLPIDVWHGSQGMKIDYKYYSTLINIVKEYEEDTDVIYTTCGMWITVPFFIWFVKLLSKSVGYSPIGQQLLLNSLPLLFGLLIPIISEGGMRKTIGSKDEILIRIR